MIKKINGGKIPQQIKTALASKDKGGKFKACYDERSGHFIANKAKYKPSEAAALAMEQGYRPDIERLEDISISWAAFRFNGNSPSGYAEVEAGTRGAFPVWAFPVLVMEQ